VLTAIAGGVGAARMLAGVVAVLPADEVCAVINTGDDIVLHGLHVSPDIDTVTYTLAGAIDPERGWGLAGESWSAMAALDRYGGQSWFRLGDRDLATHLYRTQRLAEQATLSQVTAEVAAAWGLRCRLLPMSDDRVETRLTVPGPAGTSEEIGFQDWFVGRAHADGVESVRFVGADDAEPAPGVLAAIADADRILICPSNPIVSVAPVLAVPGVRPALAARRADVVAVSPLVAGRALKGPADTLMASLGHEVSVVGVARLYAPFAATLVVDHADAHLASAVEAEGLTCIVTATVMHGPPEAAALARIALRSV